MSDWVDNLTVFIVICSDRVIAVVYSLLAG